MFEYYWSEYSSSESPINFAERRHYLTIIWWAKSISVEKYHIGSKIWRIKWGLIVGLVYEYTRTGMCSISSSLCYDKKFEYDPNIIVQYIQVSTHQGRLFNFLNNMSVYANASYCPLYLPLSTLLWLSSFSTYNDTMCPGISILPNFCLSCKLLIYEEFPTAKHTSSIVSSSSILDGHILNHLW